MMVGTFFFFLVRSTLRHSMHPRPCENPSWGMGEGSIWWLVYSSTGPHEASPWHWSKGARPSFSTALVSFWSLFSKVISYEEAGENAWLWGLIARVTSEPKPIILVSKRGGHTGRNLKAKKRGTSSFEPNWDQTPSLSHYTTATPHAPPQIIPPVCGQAPLAQLSPHDSDSPAILSLYLARGVVVDTFVSVTYGHSKG